jgi:hypothetical protein
MLAVVVAVLFYVMLIFPLAMLSGAEAAVAMLDNLQQPLLLEEVLFLVLAVVVLGLVLTTRVAVPA